MNTLEVMKNLLLPGEKIFYGPFYPPVKIIPENNPITKNRVVNSKKLPTTKYVSHKGSTLPSDGPIVVLCDLKNLLLPGETFYFRKFIQDRVQESKQKDPAGLLESQSDSELKAGKSQSRWVEKEDDVFIAPKNPHRFKATKSRTKEELNTPTIPEAILESHSSGLNTRKSQSRCVEKEDDVFISPKNPRRSKPTKRRRKEELNTPTIPEAPTTQRRRTLYCPVSFEMTQEIMDLFEGEVD